MLSDEEKKAIEYLKIEYEKLMKEDNILFPLYKSNAKRLIDIIEKQSKEIEELKEELEICEADLDEMTISNDHKKKEWVNKLVLNSYIPKSKVKEKIEELNKDFKEYENGQEWEIQDEIRGQIDVLQSLLEKE